MVLTLGDASHARRLLLRDVAEGLSPYGGLGVGLGELPGRLLGLDGGVVDVLFNVYGGDPAGVGALGRVVQACPLCSPWCPWCERPSAAGQQEPG